jgi:hypothetical protein
MIGPVRGVATVLAILAVTVVASCGGGGSEDEEEEEKVTLPGLSGLAWLGGDRFLAVHDAKNPNESDLVRATILRLPRSLDGIQATALELEWPDPQGESSDLESADRVPGTNRLLLAESGNDGSEFHRIFLAEQRDDAVRLIEVADWPARIHNVEGIAVGRAGDRLVFLYAERAQGEDSTEIAWAELRVDPVLQFGEFRRVRYASPEPTGPNGRPVSALTVDGSGRLYVASAFDPRSDSGPYKSFVWRAGRLRAGPDGPELVLAREPELLGALDGFKVESVAVRESGGRMTVLAGTDDENYGGTLRPLPSAP